MNTTAPTTGDARLFRSPLRVTSEAVELRDRAYPIQEIRSAQVVKIRADSLGLRLGIMAFAYFLGTALVLLVRYLMQIAANGAPLFQLPQGYSAFTADSDSTLKTMLFVLAIAGLVGLFVASRVRSLSGRYLYAANLRSPFWSTIVAASREEAPVGQVVSAVKQALREKAESLQPSADTNATPEGAQPEVYYQEENTVSIDDTWLELPGKSYPVSSLHFATAYPVVGQSIRDTFTNSGLVGLGFGVLNGLSSDPQVREVAWVPLVLYLLAGAAISGFFFLVNKRKGGPLAIIHVCWVRTAHEDTVVFHSIDQGYTEQVVRAINETVHRRDGRRGTMARIASRP
ncbi:MAG: hypothetical protein QOH93_460 [Chloroflexia bacterium]|jgi:hypothetical protein|nr:hypothetical protein [Chloroflexia bacterium]